MGAQHIAFPVHDAVRLSADLQPRNCFRSRSRFPGMNLISVYFRSGTGCGPSGSTGDYTDRLRGLLFLFKNHIHIQQTKPGSLRNGRLRMIRIAEPVTEHLVSSADTDDHSAAARMADNGPVQPAVSQVDQVLNRILGAGKNDEVGVFQVAGIFRIAQAAARLKGQGLEIGKVGNMAELHHGNINISCTAPAAETLRDAVLILQFHIHPWNDAEDGYMDPVLQHP